MISFPQTVAPRPYLLGVTSVKAQWTANWLAHLIILSQCTHYVILTEYAWSQRYTRRWPQHNTMKWWRHTQHVMDATYTTSDTYDITILLWGRQRGEPYYDQNAQHHRAYSVRRNVMIWSWAHLCSVFLHWMTSVMSISRPPADWL